MNTTWAVVYGGSWEDIAYFTDLSKAKRKLVIQALGVSTEFRPFVYGLYPQLDGTMCRTRHTYSVDANRLAEVLNAFTAKEVAENPVVALGCVKLDD